MTKAEAISEEKCQGQGKRNKGKLVEDLESQVRS